MEVKILSSIYGTYTYLVWLDVMCVWWLLKLIMHTYMRLRLYIKTLAPSTLQMQIQEDGLVRNFGFVYCVYTIYDFRRSYEPPWFGRRTSLVQIRTSLVRTPILD